MSEAPIIEIQDLAKRFGPVRALDGLSLEVRRSEIFGFLGPNGAGKTTTLRLLTGFLRPTSGRALVMGMDSWRESVKVRRHVGFLPDAPGFYDDMTGQDYLSYLGSFSGKADASVQRSLCDTLELSDAALRRPIRGYSRGMRQKIAIVQALQHRPSLLVMDEPTASLDPLMQQALFTLLTQAQGDGTTVFFSSHILSEAEHLCDRVGLIRDGRMVAVMGVEELRSASVRHVEVLFTHEPPSDALDLPQVVSSHRDGRRWTLTIQGDINPVLRAITAHDLEDLVLEPAHLEDVFLTYYRQEEERG